jgi:hypothetical protein
MNKLRVLLMAITSLILIHCSSTGFENREVKYYNIYCKGQLNDVFATNYVQGKEFFTVKLLADLVIPTKYPSKVCKAVYIKSVWK